MNVLCATRCIVYENRWHLLLTAVAIGMGYLMGRYYVGDHGLKSADCSRDGGGGGGGATVGTTEGAATITGMTSVTAGDPVVLRLPADCWRVIVAKIAKISDDMEELRELAAGAHQQQQH